MRGDKHIQRRLGVEMIGGLADLDPCCLRQASARDAGVLRMRVETRSYRRAAEGHARQLVHRCPSPADRLLDLACVPLELLAEADGRRVLQVGTTRLDQR